MGKIKDLTGKVFGELTVIQVSGKRRGYYEWECLCTCGKSINVLSVDLIRRHSVSCGHGTIQAAKNRLFRTYKNNARSRDLVFNITEDIFHSMVQQNCYYCGRSPSNTMQNAPHLMCYVYNGLDRIHNDEGYTINNCVPCCFICNRAKMDLSLDEFNGWLNDLVNYRKGEPLCQSKD